MKVLITGLGSIGKKHVLAIKSVQPQSEIFALRTHKEADDFLDVKNIFSFSEIENLGVEFIIIANPTAEHKNTIEKLIDFNLPLFIEKPIFNTLAIEDIVNSLENNKIQTYVACNLRFLDCIKYVQEYLLQNPQKRINEVNVYCGSYLPDWRPKVDFRTIYSVNKEQGGGVHLDLIHELDYLYWIFGMPQNVNRYLKSNSSLNISAVDYANYRLDYSNFSTNVVLNYYRRDAKRIFEIVFDTETWVINLLKNQVLCNSKVIFTSNQLSLDTYSAQMDYFYKCVKNKTTTFNTITDAFNVLKISLD